MVEEANCYLPNVSAVKANLRGISILGAISGRELNNWRRFLKSITVRTLFGRTDSDWLEFSSVLLSKRNIRVVYLNKLDGFLTPGSNTEQTKLLRFCPDVPSLHQCSFRRVIVRNSPVDEKKF